MEIEGNVLKCCDRDLTCLTDTESPDRRHPSLKALASVRALIVNPSTPDETISRVLETIIQSLQHDHELLHHHALKLLSDLVLHRDLSHAILERLYAYVSVRNDASRLTAKALAVLMTSAEHHRSFSTSSTSYELSEYFFLLLCSSPSVSVRSWILSNANRFHVCPFRLLPVLLQFTSDPYPYVRRAALDGILSLRELANVKERGLIKSCYDRAAELLLDTNECVRCVAVRVVSEWGHTLATLDNEVGIMDWFDAVFTQLCAMVRDMSIKVRSEAFAALGDTKLVSEDLLLQTLAKKITKDIKERKISGLCISKESSLLASNVAGVFLHGLEDEYNEVRKIACMSLGKLTILSVQFAEDALNLLMDMLNDDTVAVRLQCLQTMYHMSTCDRLKVQQIHMHMFLSTLLDSSTLIRCATRKILRSMKLTDLDIFKLVTSGLLTNLDSYPEDETDIFNVLFSIGRSRGNFAVSFVMEAFQEIETFCEGELHFGKARVAAVLVLAIGASLAHEQRICSISTRIFTYAIPFLGRISHSISDFISQDTLFAYLSHCTRSMDSPIAGIFRHEENSFSVVGDILSQNSKEIISKVVPLRQISYGASENLYKDSHWDPRHTMSVAEYQQNLAFMEKEERHAIDLVLRTVAETWPLIKAGCMDEVRRTLRSCKEELAKISAKSSGSAGLLAFACQYVRVIRLLGKVWEDVFTHRKFNGCRPGSLDLLLEKLDINIRRMRYGFLGFSIEVELHILDILLLTCSLKLSKSQICGRLITLGRLRATISSVELLLETGFMPSEFARELKSLFQEPAGDDVSYYSVHLERVLELFSLKQVLFAEKLRHIKADIDVPGNDSENPLSFISGLPAAITFEITVHNVSSEDRLWLKMAVEELTRYVYLDFDQFEVHDCFGKVTLSVPFYRAPRAASFTLRACIGKECSFEDVQFAKDLGGPKHELTFLCNDKEVYFVLRS